MSYTNRHMIISTSSDGLVRVHNNDLNSSIKYTYSTISYTQNHRDKSIPTTNVILFEYHHLQSYFKEMPIFGIF